MTNNLQEHTDDDIRLIDILCFLSKNRILLSKGTLVFTLLGVAVSFILPVKYEATAFIQTAKVANSDVEAPAILVEKMKIPTYFSAETWAACQINQGPEPGVQLAHDLDPKISKTTTIISIKYQGKSSDEAKACLEAVIQNVRANQDVLAKPILESKQHQLAVLKEKLEAAQKITKVLSLKNPVFDFSDNKFSAASLLLATSLSQQNEVRDLELAVDDLVTSLASPQTQGTYINAPIYAPDVKVAPKRTLITLLSGFGGFVLLIFYLLGRDFFRNLKVRSDTQGS